MKAAMRAKDAQRLAAIRLLLAAIKQREVDERRELADADVLATIEKMIKQRRDSIAQFEAGGREDLARSEAVRADPPAELPAAAVVRRRGRRGCGDRHCGDRCRADRRKWGRSWRCSRQGWLAGRTCPRCPRS